MSGADEINIRERLQQWLCKRYPDAEGLAVSEFSSPAAGASNETLLFDASWRQQGKDYKRSLVARIQPTGVGVFPQYDLALQYRTVELLADTEIPVPVLAGFESDSRLLGAPFYLMERIEGEVVTENPPYNVDGWFKDASVQERREIWRSGVCAMAQVNRQDWRGLGFEFLLPQAGQTPLQQQLAYYREFLQWTEAKGRPYPRLWAIYQWLLAMQPRHEPTALCWGDAKVANLLFRDRRVVAVLDWEMVRLGNPVDDLAWWFTLDNSQSEGLARLLGMVVAPLPGILERDEVIGLWQQESGHSVEHLDYYEVLGAFKFGVIMASVGSNLMRDGVMPPEMEFDINNTSTPLIERLMEQHGIA